MTTVTPSVLWAQRSSANEPSKNVIYLTIEVLDPIDTKLDLTSSSLKFSADSQDKQTHYDLNIEFYDEIDPEKSHKNTESGSHIYLVLRKKTDKDEYWPRLTKEKLKYHYIKTDFDKWVDEDEQDEQPEEEDTSNMMNLGGGGAGGGAGGGDFDFSQLMQGMGGAGAGGPGNFDIGSLASQLGGAGAGGPGNFDIGSLASQLGQAGASAGEVDDDDKDAEEQVEETGDKAESKTEESK